MLRENLLTEQPTGIPYILMDSVIKLDATLTTGQFLIQEYSFLLRIYQKNYGRAIRLYALEKLLSKLISSEKLPKKIFYLK